MFLPITVDIIDGNLSYVLSRDARLLHVEAQAWAARYETGHKIPLPALRRMTDCGDVEAAVAELVEYGLWQQVDGGWKIYTGR